MKTFLSLHVFVLTFLLSLFLNNQTAYSQVTLDWVQIYDSTNNSAEYGLSVDYDDSGNVYVGGIAIGGILIKYNSSGAELWKRNIFAHVWSVKVANSNNIYVYGDYISGCCPEYKSAIAKFNSNGDQLWSKLLYDVGGGNNSPEKMQVDHSGNLYITGYNPGYLTKKFNSNGDSLWGSIYNGQGIGFCFSSSLWVDSSGNAYVTGSSQGIGTNYDYATVKYNSSGIEQWVRIYNGPGNSNDNARYITADESGNVYVTGITYLNFNDIKCLTVKYNSNGDLLWAKTFQYLQYDSYPYEILVDNSENVYVLDAVGIVKYNSSGNLDWFKMGNYGTESPTNAALDKEGNIYVSDGTIFPNLIRTKKYNKNGDSIWTVNYLAQIPYVIYSGSIKVDNYNNVYLAMSRLYSNGDLIALKYSQTKTLNLSSLIEGFYNNVSNKMIRDTMIVYLRNNSPPFALVDSSKSVLDSNGNGAFYFSNASNVVSYYIVLKHRNSIETWSKTGVAFSSNSLNYDFTTAADKAFGDNLILKGSKYCVFSGDVNQDGNVDAADLSAVDNDVFNFISGYVRTDVTGNNVTDANDLAITDNNVFNFVHKLIPP